MHISSLLRTALSMSTGDGRRASAFCILLVLAAGTQGVYGQEIPDSSPVADALEEADAAVRRIVAVPDNQRTFDNTVGAIDDMVVTLRRNTEFLQFMAYVSTDGAERQRGQQAEKDVQNWLIGLGKREDLYNAVEAYAETKPPLKGEQDRLLKHTRRDYRRGGMMLPAEQREQLKTIQMEITKLGLDFQQQIRADETRVPLTREELSGMSDEYLAGIDRVDDLYLVDMSYPSFLPLTNYCDNETTRKKAWVAYKRRGGRKNVELLEKIIKLRAEAARLLGYETVADYETEIRMAKNADTVKRFYADLRTKVRAKALLDMEEFTAAKREHTGDPDAKLYPWDQSFYEKWLLKTKYQVDSRKVSEYFPIDRVIDGLFSITQSLYGLEYRDVTSSAAASPDERPLWHPDVKKYEVYDKSSGDLLGEFFLDLHPRPNKFNHAAMWPLQPRKVLSDGSVQKPIAALVCNFTKPTKDKPSLLTHDEVETFFHEFGHCLHGILTETKYGEFSGTSVPRDFVEAPSQMFENWVWDSAVLKSFARHYKTGEKFPEELLAGMLKARHLGSGIKTEHQFYYGQVDFAYHTTPDGEVDTTEVADKLFGEIELYDPVPGTYFQAAFGHLVGYEAGYYGYMWSLVYAADMFQRFKELGMLDPEAGMYYRKRILARGGSMEAIDMVRDYLGREPEMDAFLRHLGLAE